MLPTLNKSIIIIIIIITIIMNNNSNNNNPHLCRFLKCGELLYIKMLQLKNEKLIDLGKFRSKERTQNIQKKLTL